MNQSTAAKFMDIQAQNAAYQHTIVLAQATLQRFKQQLAQLDEEQYACVKVFLPETQDATEGANIWLMQPFFEANHCYAQPFELPEEMTWLSVGQWLKFAEEDILDWYILPATGEVQGGYSLRYQRSLLQAEQQNAFDQRVSLSRFVD